MVEELEEIPLSSQAHVPMPECVNNFFPDFPRLMTTLGQCDHCDVQLCARAKVVVTMRMESTKPNTPPKARHSKGAPVVLAGSLKGGWSHLPEVPWHACYRNRRKNKSKALDPL